MLVPEFWYGRSRSEVGDFMVWMNMITYPTILNVCIG
jgi:hypothetical protein